MKRTPENREWKSGSLEEYVCVHSCHQPLVSGRFDGWSMDGLMMVNDWLMANIWLMDDQ